MQTRVYVDGFNLYYGALNTLPEVEIHFGSFLAKTAWRPLINLPVADKNLIRQYR